MSASTSTSASAPAPAPAVAPKTTPKTKTKTKTKAPGVRLTQHVLRGDYDADCFTGLYFKQTTFDSASTSADIVENAFADKSTRAYSSADYKKLTAGGRQLAIVKTSKRKADLVLLVPGRKGADEAGNILPTDPTARVPCGSIKGVRLGRAKYPKAQAYDTYNKTHAVKKPDRQVPAGMKSALNTEQEWLGGAPLIKADKIDAYLTDAPQQAYALNTIEVLPSFTKKLSADKCARAIRFLTNTINADDLAVINKFSDTALRQSNAGGAAKTKIEGVDKKILRLLDGIINGTADPTALEVAYAQLTLFAVGGEQNKVLRDTRFKAMIETRKQELLKKKKTKKVSKSKIAEAQKMKAVLTACSVPDIDAVLTEQFSAEIVALLV